MKIKIKGKRASRNDQLFDYLMNEIKPGDSVLDIGCGPKVYSTPLLQKNCRVMTVDAWHVVEPDVVADLEKIPITEVTQDHWDYIFMIDFIEHLDRGAAERLLQDCKRIVRKKIFLLTPLPEIWTDNVHNVENENLWCHGNQYDVHKSSWIRQDFQGWTPLQFSTLEHYFVGYHEA